MEIVARGEWRVAPQRFPHKVPKTSAWSKRRGVVISRISDVPNVPLSNATHRKPLQWRPYDQKVIDVTAVAGWA